MQSGQLRVATVFALSTLLACSAGKPNSGFGSDPAAGPGGDTDAGTDLNNPGPVVGGNDGGMAKAVCAPGIGNYEVPMNGCDDDNDGTVDNVTACDHGIAIAGNADEFVKALGVCQSATGTGDKKWGVVSAAYTRGYNQTVAPADGQHGILQKFGAIVKPREGEMLGALSSGWAREFNGDNDTTTAFKGTHTQMTGGGALPPTFPRASGTCVLDTKVKDVASVKLQIKVPDNAKGIAFDFNFHSGEWPEYVCTKFNDGFIAYLTSSALPGGKADNISFDAMGNTVSVNNGFFDRCTPNAKTACNGISFNPGTLTAACMGGESELAGTGFEDKGIYCGMNIITGAGPTTTGGGATGWLTSQAPVKPGEIITLEFMIWDTGDTAFDSSVLLDHLTWVPTATITGTGRPPQ